MRNSARWAWLFSLTCAIGMFGGGSLPSARAEARSGCNMWGCWYNGGGCNQWGCYNTSYGECNQWGCSNNGACNMHGCPPGPTVATRRTHVRAPIIVPQRVTPGPTYQRAPAPPPPPDYAQESDQPTDVIRSFDQAGLHFEYAQALLTEVQTGSLGAYVSLTGPRSFSANILRKKTTSSPELVRSETVDGLADGLVERGLKRAGRSVISADFRDGVRQGVRVRLDNRDDIILHDAFAWRRADGYVIVVLFAYKQGDADLAMRFLPTITRSLE